MIGVDAFALTGGDNISDDNPRLGPLADNGGPTQTHALLPGSRAIDAGDPNFSAPPDFDQRGMPFVRVSDGRIDMGAFEYQIEPIDFNDDKQLNCVDVDELATAIVTRNHAPRFDLTGDALVTQGDVAVWLALAGLANLPSHVAYLLGDANLDGVVDAMDLNVVGVNWLQPVTGWCSGDFNADGVVDALDLNEVGINWLRDVSGQGAAAVNRVPRAPLATKPNIIGVAANSPMLLMNDAPQDDNAEIRNVVEDSDEFARPRWRSGMKLSNVVRRSVL